MNLVSIKNSSSKLPVIKALSRGNIKFCRYLYSLTPVEDLKPENGRSGATLCTWAIYTRTLGNNFWSNYIYVGPTISDDI